MHFSLRHKEGSKKQWHNLANAICTSEKMSDIPISAMVD